MKRGKFLKQAGTGMAVIAISPAIIASIGAKTVPEINLWLLAPNEFTVIDRVVYKNLGKHTLEIMEDYNGKITGTSMGARGVLEYVDTASGVINRKVWDWEGVGLELFPKGN